MNVPHPKRSGVSHIKWVTSEFEVVAMSLFFYLLARMFSWLAQGQWGTVSHLLISWKAMYGRSVGRSVTDIMWKECWIQSLLFLACNSLMNGLSVGAWVFKTHLNWCFHKPDRIIWLRPSSALTGWHALLEWAIKLLGLSWAGPGSSVFDAEPS